MPLGSTSRPFAVEPVSNRVRSKSATAVPANHDTLLTCFAAIAISNNLGTAPFEPQSPFAKADRKPTIRLPLLVPIEAVAPRTPSTAGIHLVRPTADQTVPQPTVQATKPTDLPYWISPICRTHGGVRSTLRTRRWDSRGRSWKAPTGRC